MRGDYAPQYDTPCVLLRDSDTDVEAVIDFAKGISATFEEEPGDKMFVIQFPDRPQELYSEEALRRSRPFSSKKDDSSESLTDSVVVHLAGTAVRLGNRIIQRCLICGEKLCDNLGSVAPLNEYGSVLTFPVWGIGELVEHTGNRWAVVGETDSPNFQEGSFPENCCVELVK